MPRGKPDTEEAAQLELPLPGLPSARSRDPLDLALKAVTEMGGYRFPPLSEETERMLRAWEDCDE